MRVDYPIWRLDEEGYFNLKHDETHINEAISRDIRPPKKYNEYELTECDMRPQTHSDHYRFRNLNIQGELHAWHMCHSTNPKYMVRIHWNVHLLYQYSGISLIKYSLTQILSHYQDTVLEILSLTTLLTSPKML
jgi:hypothetical protein